MMKQITILALSFAVLVGCSKKETSDISDADVLAEIEGMDSDDAISTDRFTYSSSDGEELTGFIASPGQDGKYPGVLIIHEWWGHNGFVDRKARALAEAGYVGYALDMFGDTAAHPKDAGAMSKMAYENFDQSKARFEAALADLKSRPNVDTTKLAVIGYCFGGGMAINMGLLYPDQFDAVASFHGSLGSLKEPTSQNIQTKFIVHNGAADPFVKEAQIEALKTKMNALNADLAFYNYEGAKHAFTNPGADANGQKFEIPLAYNAKADKESWERTMDLFESTF